MPYMADERHADDTLFIVAEEDWRIYEKDCHGAGGRENLELTAEATAAMEDYEATSIPELYAQRYAPQATEQEGEELTASPGASSAAIAPGHYRAVTKPSRGDFEHMAEELLDLVKLATAAQRVGKGGLIWTCWNAAMSKRKEAPSYGSTMICVSAWAARLMKRNFTRWFACTHFDVALRDALQSNEEVRNQLQACFVFPCIGHFEAHESGIISGVRDTFWHAGQWCQEGTRKKPGTDQVHRSLREFQSKGICPTVCTVVLPDTQNDLAWRTMRKSTGMSPAGERMPAELTAAGESGGHWTGGYWWGGAQVWTWEEDAGAPAEHWQSEGSRREQVPAKETESVKRIRRAQVHNYARRIFTDDFALVSHSVGSKNKSCL